MPVSVCSLENIEIKMKHVVKNFLLKKKQELNKYYSVYFFNNDQFI